MAYQRRWRKTNRTLTMEETGEEPPTSAVLLDHCHFSQIIFNSVEKFYIPGGDITCHYTLTQHFIPRRKDWVGIFRVGWKTTREYYTFMWAALPADLHSKSSLQQQVQFKAYYLPKDDEYYQFCYVDQDGVVRGASVPFQFRPESEEDILVVTTQGEVEEIEQLNKELRQQNQELKDNCLSLQKQNSDMHAELQKVQDLQEKLESLTDINKKLEQKVSVLNEENEGLKVQKGCWETELLQLKVQNQNVSSENEKMGIRLRATLDHLDKLEAQISVREKEMEKLTQGDRDKIEQLERLKKENEQLLLSLTKQREHQQKLEHTVEDMKQKDTTANRKQQEFTGPRDKKAPVEKQLVQEVERLKSKVEAGRACFIEKYKECQRLHKQIRQLKAAVLNQISDLMKRLDESKFFYQELQKEKTRVEGEKDLLQKENERLLCYVCNDSGSNLLSNPIPVQEALEENTGLVFGNPYAAAQDIQYIPILPSIKKCPICHGVFPDDVEENVFEQHLQTHILDCPFCDEVFSEAERQVYDDHVFCHSL
ncbi:calcium-binding and coiled-coil domain-containing protein 2 isoform X2 [Monodelphis domestica]|uniref:calcium-binding and coiled-coil domain-containing protein 2 isoform X2 n=1 Tax=Monodelphis domestica TaxID=13616 RepID=UPI0024E22BAD|nr:calcium-binding and coiled-coil domain-containing protein 2 isoform X2 [Monodelphis domestica]